MDDTEYKFAMYKNNREIDFNVPGKIIAKQSCKFTKTGIVYTPKEIKDYAKLIQKYFRINYPIHSPDIYKDVPLDVGIWTYFKASKEGDEYRYYTKKPDPDNIAKNVCDALKGLVYPDDRFIVRLSIRKWYGLYKDEEYLRIFVKPAHS